MLIGIPQVLYPLSVLLIDIPDFGYALLVSGLLALGWSAVWSGLIFFSPLVSRQTANVLTIKGANVV